ncbi:MAG: hypothetical protein Q9201_004539 [Fulgogasparrea decipioides]
MLWITTSRLRAGLIRSLFVGLATYSTIARGLPTPADSRPLAFTPAKYLQPRQPIANSVDLRVLPLGDSITWGKGSSDGNGYRLALATLTKKDGNNLRYIGHVESGTMANNQHEGHSGFEIVAVSAMGRPDYAERPNVVLLMAGTNDILRELDVGNAPERLGVLIGDIVTACPEAAVLVGTLPPLDHPYVNPKLSDKETIAFNTVLEGIVAKLATGGNQVALVDMGRVTTRHIHATDGIHPTDEGYALIAAAWHDGLVTAGRKGWIQPPLPRPSNERSIEGDKPLIVNHGSTMNDPKIWSLEQLLVGLLILSTLFWLACKAVMMLGRRYKR